MGVWGEREERRRGCKKRVKEVKIEGGRGREIKWEGEGSDIGGVEGMREGKWEDNVRMEI